MKIIFLSILLGFSCVYAGSVYEWDNDGVPTFSNTKPSDNAKEIKTYAESVPTAASHNVSKQDVDNIRSKNNASMQQNNYSDDSSMSMGQQDVQPPMYTDYYYDYDGKNRTMWGLPSQNMNYGYQMYGDYGRLGNGANGVIDSHFSKGGSHGRR